ncbi:MAG: hypothetical protein WCJ57_00260 [Candidatus Falkowbacteria bacterium]
MEDNTEKAHNDMHAFKKAVQNDTNPSNYNLNRLNLTGELNLERDTYILKGPNQYWAQTTKPLGSKNVIADIMFETNDQTYYNLIAQDVVASTLNRLITTGALPATISLSLITSDHHWLDCQKRTEELRSGWRQACMSAKCVSAGISMSQTKNLILQGLSVLVGSGIGVINDKKNFINEKITNGDVIVLIRSSGVNSLCSGFDLIDNIAIKISNGYMTRIGNSNSHPTFGESLLTPGISYSPLIKECQKKNINIHYAVDVNNWLDLMRAPKKFSYIIEDTPILDPIFNFIQQQGEIEDREAYANFNMNAGLALYVSEEEAKSVVKLAEDQGFKANIAGYIKSSSKRKLTIKEKNLVYTI